jgi:hypothetical protein
MFFFQPKLCCRVRRVPSQLGNCLLLRLHWCLFLWSRSFASMRSTSKLLATRAALPKDHVTLRQTRINAVAAARLHEVFLQRKYTSCVWVSAALVRDCKLARRGEEPVTAPQHSGGEYDYYNLDQLLQLARTATGTWFPMNVQRTFSSEGFKHQHRSNVWFTERQLGCAIEPRPGQAPSLLTVSGAAERLYNTDQLVAATAGHVLDNGCGAPGVERCVKGVDVFVMTSGADKHGFVSNRWCCESIVGLRPGIEPKVKIFNRRFGVVGMYNRDQLEWPIPVPDPPHRWANGSPMLPHDQMLLEQARVTLGVASRRWTAAQPQAAKNNVQPGAEATQFDNPIPRGVQEVINVDQLIDATTVL